MREPELVEDLAEVTTRASFVAVARRGAAAPELDAGLRFAVLWVSLVASTASMYRHLAELILDRDQTLLACLGGRTTGQTATQLEPGTAQFVRIRICAVYLPERPVLAAFLGVAVLFAVMVVFAGLSPRIVSRRGRMTPLNRQDYPRTSAYLSAGESEFGLSARPQYWVREDSASVWSPQGRAFGSDRRPQIFVNRAFTLACEHGRAGSVERAVLLHELAHIAQRDLSRHQRARACWWAFLVVTVIPFTVVTLSMSYWGVNSAAAEFRTAVTVLLLIGLVYVARAAVVRGREFSANALAGQLDPEAMASGLASDPRARPERSSWRDLVNWHPKLTARQRVYENPDLLLGRSVLPLALAGIALGVINAELMGLVSLLVVALFISQWIQPVAWLCGGLVGALLSGFVVAAAWQRALAARSDERRERSAVLWPSILLAAGFVIGESLSVSSAVSGVWGTPGDRGWRQLIDEVISFGLLSGILIGLFSWSSGFAATWGFTSRSVRTGGVISWLLAVLGTAPLIVVWTYSHRSALVREIYWPVPGGNPLLHATDSLSIAAPGLSRLEAEYFPLDMVIRFHVDRLLCAGPLVTVPFVAWCWLAARGSPCRAVSPPRLLGAVWRAGLAGLVAATLTSAVVDVLIRNHFRGAYLADHRTAATSYVASVTLLIILAASFLAGAILAVREPLTGPVLAVVAGLVTAVGSALLAPFLIHLGVDGFPGLAAPLRDWTEDRTGFSLIAVQAAVLVVLVGLPLWALLARILSLWPVARVQVHGHESASAGSWPAWLAYAGSGLVWSALLVAAYYGESAFPSAFGIGILAR